MAALVLALGSQATALAHPMGNFSVNRYTRLEISPDGVRARYVLDLAEIPTLSELRAAGVEGRPSQADHDAILRAKSAELAAGARLSLDGRSIAWQVQDATLEYVPGQADLDTTRVVVDLVAAQPVNVGARIQYRDTNYGGRIGWHEIVIRGVDDFVPQESTAPSVDDTNELRSYPLDPTRPPSDQSEASARVVLRTNPGGEPGSSLQHNGASRFAVDPRTDYLAAFLKGGVAGPASLMLALLAAAGLGALHALEPGHGKTIVSGYLVGSRGTARQAMLLGLSVTATHTLSVYLLGLATLVAARFILPDRLYPILGTASGLAVVAVGLTLVRARLGPALVAARHPRHSSPVPTPMDGTSLATVGHSHPHSHEHGHHHDIHELGHTHVHEAPGMDVHQAAQWVGNGLAPHSHGIGPSHTHPVPGADGSPLSARSLLALGVSGGLLPCPSALVVLLAAISFGNIGLGMALVAAFSVGLALVLMGLGLVVVFGGRAVARTPLALRLSGSPLAGALPALSAVVITIAGTGITLQAIGTWM